MSLTLRDELAIDRTRLANQRTLLAMVRTGLYLILMGLSILSLDLLEEMRYVSGVLLFLGTATILIGLVLWKKQKNKINQAYINV